MKSTCSQELDVWLFDIFPSSIITYNSSNVNIQKGFEFMFPPWINRYTCFMQEFSIAMYQLSHISERALYRRDWLLIHKSG